MKILRLQSYYFPERVASSHLIHDQFEGFSRADMQTVLFVPTPSRGIDKATRKQYKQLRYEKAFGGAVEIFRFPMLAEGRNPIVRAVRYFLCSLTHYRKGIACKDMDLVYAASTPPTQGLLSAKVAKKLSKKYGRKVPFVYNLQDVFPDSLVTTGLTKKGSLLWKIGRKIEDYTYAHADKIIVISESMKQNIMEKGVPEGKITVVSNWIDTEATKPIPKEENRLFDEFGIARDKFTVVYAGNFGKAQGAQVVLDAAEKLSDCNDVQFVIFGGGAEFAVAKEYAASMENVIIHPLLPQERVSEVYSLGDVALITCKKGIGNSGMPSKTWSIMACNTPIIAAFDTDSELAEILARSGAGISVEPENVSALADAIFAVKNGDISPQGGRDFVCENAEKKLCVAKYVKTIVDAVDMAAQMKANC